MTKRINYQDVPVHYTVEGSGEPLLFLHGYLESLHIWDDFVTLFAPHYRVIRLDIPGHGDSETLGSVHDMGEMARVAAAVLDEEKIDKAVVIGHSMGGYVTMELVHLFSERVKGYVLFHSTCFADSEEKKENRDREISLVMCGKRLQIIRTNIPRGFANDNQERMKERIEWAIRIASGCPDEGVIALLRGMRGRHDHSEIFARPLPKRMLIWGEKDNYIGEPVFRKMTGMASGLEVLVLKNSGHMGFIEEPDVAFAGIRKFIASLDA